MMLCKFNTMLQYSQFAAETATVVGVIVAIVSLIIGYSHYLKQKKIDAITGYYSNLQRHLRIFLTCFELTADQTKNLHSVLFYFCKKEEDARGIPDEERKIFENFRMETIKAILNSSTRFTVASTSKGKNTEKDYLKEDFVKIDFDEDILLDTRIDILLKELVYLRDIDKENTYKIFNDKETAIRYIKQLEKLVETIMDKISSLAKSLKINI